MTRIQRQQRALRAAISALEHFDRKGSHPNSEGIREDIDALRDLLIDVRQLPLPLEKEARA